ncbi:MAG TPA: MFS transporter [Pseudobacteroides sp.]|uniref:MFS transporter n=1 Tax=Pseudobacteroides sp. TaxID=1968840 RepID=UPI002F92794E
MMTETNSVKRELLWTRNYIIILLSSLFTYLGFQILIPTLPVYVSQHSGSSSDVGLVIGILTISALIIRPFSGTASDIVGRKKILYVGLVISLITMVIYFFATTVVSILLVRIIHGVGWGISTAAFGSLVSDIVPTNRRGEGIGYFGFSTLLSGALGPTIGIGLMNSFNFSAVLIFATISAFLSLLLMLWVTPPKVERGESTSQQTPFIARLIEKTSLFPSTLLLLLGVVYGGIVSFITLFSNETGIKNVGWFFLFFALGSFLVRTVSGKLFDKKGHSFVVIPGTFFVLAGVLSLSYASSTILLSIAAILYGVGMGAIQPTLQAWVINRAAPNRRGAANSTFFSAFDLGIGGGSMILGSIARETNYAMMYRISSVFLIAFLIVYCIYLVKVKTPKQV